MTSRASTAEAAPPPDMVTDLGKLRVAMQTFRERGFWARAGQEGGIDAVPDDRMLRGGKFVLWDEGEMTAFDGRTLTRELHLRHFHKHAQEILEVLNTPALFNGRARLDSESPFCVVITPAKAR